MFCFVKQISEKIELIKREITSDVDRTFTSSIKPQTGQQRQPIRLQYVPANDKGAKGSKLKPRTETGHLTVRDEINRMDTIVQGLQEEHLQLRDRLKKDMDVISDRMVGAVCIPPIGQSKY